MFVRYAVVHFSFVFPPSQPMTLLASVAQAHKGTCPLSFILQTVTSFHRPRVHNYYGFVCNPAPLMLSLAFQLV